MLFYKHCLRDSKMIVDRLRQPLIGHIRSSHSIYQYTNMAPRLSGQTSILGVVFFVLESLSGIERQKKLKKFTILTRKPRSHVRILIYRTWPINRAAVGVRGSCFTCCLFFLVLSVTISKPPRMSSSAN